MSRGRCLHRPGFSSAGRGNLDACLLHTLDWFVIASQCSHWRGNPFPRRAAKIVPYLEQMFAFCPGLWYNINSCRTRAAGYHVSRRFVNKTPAVDVAP